MIDIRDLLSWIRSLGQFTLLWVVASGSLSQCLAQDLESQLKSMNSATLAQQAKQTGDAARGRYCFISLTSAAYDAIRLEHSLKSSDLI